MPMNNSLIVRGPGGKLTVDFSSEAKAAKERALTQAGYIQQVSKPEENEIAVTVQQNLNDLLKQVETDRKAAKAPFLAYMLDLDTAAKDFVSQVKSELNRVSALVGDFATLEAARVRAAEAATKLELETLEKERQNALANASDHDDLDAINERFDDEIRSLPVTAPARADGQIIKADWDIEVTDAWLLARMHPACVKIEPRLSAIKELLNLGMELKGIKATKIVNATVRTTKTQKAIEV